MKTGRLAACALMIGEAATAQEFYNEDPRQLYPLSAEVGAYNEVVPTELKNLTMCVREKFAAFALANSDGTTTFMFERPVDGGTLTYDVTLPEDLNTGVSMLGVYKTLPPEEVNGEMVVYEAVDELNRTFSYPVSQEALFIEGMFGQMNPDDFQMRYLLNFEAQMSELKELCTAGALKPVDLQRFYDDFWAQALGWHEAVKSKLMACLETETNNAASIEAALSQYSYPLTEYADHGFETPEALIYELEAAGREAQCTDL